MTAPRDTAPAAHRIHIDLMKQAPGWRKLQLADQLYQSLRKLALAGLRSRYPEASEEELRRRLADILLGVELAERAYGPLANFVSPRRGGRRRAPAR